MELVNHVFSRFIQQSVVKEDILDMMEQFGLIAKFTSTGTHTEYFVPAQLKTPPEHVWKEEPSSSDPCALYVHFADGFVPHGLFTQLMSTSISWCCQTWQIPPPDLYQNGVWFVIMGKHLIYDLILLCKKTFIKIVLKQRYQDESVFELESIEVASRVRVFIEDTLQKLSHEFPCLSGLQYQLRVTCPYCLAAECTNHRQVSCTHEDCLHLFELKQGQQLNCMKNFRGRKLSVRGMEKWLSLRRSQVQFSSFNRHWSWLITSIVSYCLHNKHD